MSSKLTKIISHLSRFPKRLNRQNLTTFLLVSIFPFETWAIFQVFKDADWILQRSNLMDYLAFSSYSLLFALFEGLVFAILAWLLGLFTFDRIREERLANLLGTIIWLLAFWAMVSQLLAQIDPRIEDTLVDFLFSLNHPLRTTYMGTAAASGVLVGSIVVPLALLWRGSRINRWVSSFSQRISTLSWLYLGLNFLGLLFIIYRNLAG